jgi:peroxiredoxin (alkyl hydroperoxide reductase subunit C)
MGRSIPEMLRMLDALQAIDAEGALAPANWKPGEPLLKLPTHNLDEVFGAEDETAWFLREVGQGKSK